MHAIRSQQGLSDSEKMRQLYALRERYNGVYHPDDAYERRHAQHKVERVFSELLVGIIPPGIIAGMMSGGGVPMGATIVMGDGGPIGMGRVPMGGALRARREAGAASAASPSPARGGRPGGWRRRSRTRDRGDSRRAG